MNIFLKQDVADKYDKYYHTDFGKKVDQIEQKIITELLNKVELDTKTNNEILDIGCGTGHWTEFFINKGFRPTGVDSSQSMLNIAKSKGLKAKFILANSENLPFENESYNIITSITMLEFVENRKKSIEEIYRVLKKGAYLIIGGLYNNSVLAMNKNNDSVFKHANFYDKTNLKSIFAPFKIIHHSQGVYLNNNFEFNSSTKSTDNNQALFFGLLLQKAISN